jgi:hypothetical protein
MFVYYLVARHYIVYFKSGVRKWKEFDNPRFLKLLKISISFENDSLELRRLKKPKLELKKLNTSHTMAKAFKIYCQTKFRLFVGLFIRGRTFWYS